AMGITGTDVSKDTADMVLTDDNYASIVAAVEQGRVIYGNIRKFVFFLLSCNLGEILTIFASLLFRLPLPLAPIQLLWLNLLTDGAPAMALAMEKGDPDTMKRPPRAPDEPIISRDMRWGIAVQSVAIAATTLGAFAYGLYHYPGQASMAQTYAFVTLACSELLRAYTARSENSPVTAIGIFSNRFMQLAVTVSFLLLLAVIYVPWLAPVFNTHSLSLADWGRIVPLMFIPSIIAELSKLFRRQATARPRQIP
ncbi:MAG: cation transporting ATPase C-terminal domain-containing protein, partial [Chloroflexota bacterium]|nr:cation transporting ATPase C-terminal domain-containing protein [Chloroflexota bacterium]